MLPGPGSPGARALLLLLLSVLAAARGGWADSTPSDSPVKSSPVGEGMNTNYSKFPVERHSLQLTVRTSVLEKNITLESPTLMSLTCEFTLSEHVASVNVTWTKGTEVLLHSAYVVFPNNNTAHAQYQFALITSEQMGSYSCVVGGTQEQRGTFIFKVPELNGKNKPFITYVGDTAVLVCKCPECHPVRWTWYRGNGSEQVPIDILMNDTYVISGTHSNKTKLKIMNLREEDGGTYLCQAEFSLGQSMDRLDLVVLSFLVPLKPFFGIIAEVIVLLSVILLCEVYMKKKKKHLDDGKEFEQIEQLKSDDSNGVENNAPRQRKK